MVIYSLLRRNIQDNPFKMTGFFLLKPLIYEIVRKYTSDPTIICERIIVLVECLCKNNYCCIYMVTSYVIMTQYREENGNNN